MKVLIADDDVHSRRLLELMLKQEGYEVIGVGDGSEVLKILTEPDPPRLIILDWMMPEMDGITTCRKIREQKQSDYTYIVLLTSRTKREDIITGLNAGADDYMAKPFHAQELSVRLRAGTRILELQRDLIERGRMIEEFVYAVTHDLRTPLIAMQLTMSQAREGIFGELPESYTGVLAKTNQSVDELLRLADTLLTAAKYDYDHAAPATSEAVDLHQLSISCVEELSPIWRSRGQTVTVQNPSFAAVVKGDMPSLRRVLINLLSNATKFAPADGNIEVKIDHNEGFAAVSVCNDGPALSLQEQAKLFQRFSSGNRRSVGAGLGLYLCKRIVESHGGTITYVSGDKPGSSFQFNLRLAQA